MVKEFLLNSKDMIDPIQLQWMRSGTYQKLLDCRWIRFNAKIKFAYFPDGCVALSDFRQDADLDALCRAGKLFLEAIEETTADRKLSPANFVLDLESIFLTKDRSAVRLVYLPAVVRDESKDRDIFIRRVYAVLTELFDGVEGGDTMNRQIEYQMNQKLGDFASLRQTLDKRVPEEDSSIRLQSMSEGGVSFEIDHETFRIGTDPSLSDGVLPRESGLGGAHAEIGWNEISFYVIDLGEKGGTFVNDTQIASGTQVPIGKGSRIRFGTLDFIVE
jgi:hypothetical protein